MKNARRNNDGNTAATTQEQRKKSSYRKLNSKTSKTMDIQSRNNKNRISSKSSSSLSSSDMIQTWRIFFGLEVHPNDEDNKIELSFNRQRRSKNSSSSNKRTI